MDQGNRLFISANSKKGAKLPPPVRIRRPWEDEAAAVAAADPAAPRPKRAPRRQATSAEIHSFFGRAVR